GVSFGAVHCTNEVRGETDKATNSVAIAQWMREDIGVQAIVGPSSSSVVQAVFNALEGSGTLLISPAATSPSLTDLDGLRATDDAPGLLWRTAPPDSLQGQVIADDLIGRDVLNAGVIYQDGAYGSGLANVFKDRFESQDGAASLYLFNDNNLSTAVVNAVQGGHEELLFFSSDVNDSSAFINALAALDSYPMTPLFLADTAKSSDMLAATGDAAALYPLIRGTAPAISSGSVYDFFTAAYAAEFSGDVSDFNYTAHAFDAAWLIAYGTSWALSREGEYSGINVARGLRRLSDGTEVRVGAESWSTAQATLESGGTINVQGASGELNFDDVTEETTAPIDIWVVSEDGEDFDIIYTVSFSPP
ncbi:MAG: ABC transporter substrate-binding protein, partial [Myxococcota bacterium]